MRIVRRTHGRTYRPELCISLGVFGAQAFNVTAFGAQDFDVTPFSAQAVTENWFD